MNDETDVAIDAKTLNNAGLGFPPAPGPALEASKGDLTRTREIGSRRAAS
jgi:hypothetical protein